MAALASSVSLLAGWRLYLVTFVTGLEVEAVCADLRTVHPVRRRPQALGDLLGPLLDLPKRDLIPWGRAADVVVGDEGMFVDHYAYTPNFEGLRVDKQDIIHFRNGLDTEDPKLGSSPLKSVLREVYTDDEAAAFTASLLHNMGVPGLVISPATGVNIPVDAAGEVKREVTEAFTGDRRGEPIVMLGATNIHQFGFSPEQLVLKDLRRIPEERVTAVLGVPAIVAGLGAGLDRSTFTNMGEARAAAYESGLIPMQRIMAEDIRFQLLNEFEEDPFLWRFGFDLTKVRVLQEDLLRGFMQSSAASQTGGTTT